MCDNSNLDLINIKKFVRIPSVRSQDIKQKWISESYHDGMMDSLKTVYPTVLSLTSNFSGKFWTSNVKQSRENYFSVCRTKSTKWPVRPAKTQIILGIWLDWSNFAGRIKKPWVLSYPWSTQRRLIRLGKCPGWSESLLGTQVILLVLSCTR